MASAFRFKQFAIHQDLAAMKVGTDGILLGAGTPVERTKRILDIGTGTGLIALMLAQRTQEFREPPKIVAIDVDAFAFQQASENIAKSKWANQIEVQHVELGRFSKSNRTFDFNRTFDLVVCNPPYFSQSLLSPNASRSRARHDSELSFRKLCQCASRLISQTGRISLILPFEKLDSFLEVANDNQLFLSSSCHVRSLPSKPPKRILLELGRTPQNAVQNELLIESEHHAYTPEYLALTRDFYLNR